MLQIVCIKFQQEFNFENYLHWFNEQTITQIKQYKYRKDQLIAFTSAVVKYYYLAAVLNKTPATVVLQYNSYGKPLLADINFNISHSGDYLLLAFSDQKVQIGIDIEQHNSDIDVYGMGKIVFSESEQLLVANNINNFFIMWTKKEALIKAKGTGFASTNYQNTKLTLDFIEETADMIIYSNTLLANYYFALCVNQNADR